MSILHTQASLLSWINFRIYNWFCIWVKYASSCIKWNLKMDRFHFFLKIIFPGGIVCELAYFFMSSTLPYFSNNYCNPLHHLKKKILVRKYSSSGRKSYHCHYSLYESNLKKLFDSNLIYSHRKNWMYDLTSNSINASMKVQIDELLICF